MDLEITWVEMDHQEWMDPQVLEGECHLAAETEMGHQECTEIDKAPTGDEMDHQWTEEEMDHLLIPREWK